MSKLLFVYGTLKKGFHNHGLLKSAGYITTIRVPGYKMHSMGGFPGIIPGDGAIEAELYSVPDEAWPRLDALEGYRPSRPETSMYLRKEQIVVTEVGTFTGYIYVWNGDVIGRPLVESGIW